MTPSHREKLLENKKLSSEVLNKNDFERQGVSYTIEVSSAASLPVVDATFVVVLR